MWADAPEEQKGPLCNACINLVEQLVPSLIDPDVQQNFVDIFVAVCNLAETMLDPPDYQLAAECRYMPEVYGGIFLSPSFNISLISIFTLESRHHGVRLRGRER